MKRVRVGLVGCGGVAQMMHLPYLRELDGLFEIAALCDLSPGVLRSVGDHYGVAARYTDFQTLRNSRWGQAASSWARDGRPRVERRARRSGSAAWAVRCANACATMALSTVRVVRK